MALFIPSECDCEKRPLSEQMVFMEIQKCLSHEWVVFHSFDYLARGLSKQLWDGEIDFLLYHETKGFLVIEVKGGSISYSNGQWYQDRRPIDPVEQAKHNKFAVLKLLTEKLGRPVPLKFAHAVCFPSCASGSGSWPMEAQGIVLGRQELNDIEAVATKLLEAAPMPRGIEGKVTQEEVLNILSPEFEYAQKLRDRIRDDDRQFFLLTEQQCIVLNALRNFPRLIVEGGAGTGKTVLAIKKAKMVAAEGGRALLLCFNELLAKKIRKEIDYGSGVTVGAFFNYCIELMRISKEDYEKYRHNPLLYSKVLPEFLDKFLTQCPTSYDAVIVDEAQDFTPQIWKVIPKLLAPYGHFYLFYDPDQNIFCKQLNLPEFDVPHVVLSQNCRNTRKIFEAITPYRTMEMTIAKESPVGCDVIERRGEIRALLAEELHRLYHAEKLIQSDVVVLGAHSLRNTSLGTDAQCGDYRLVEQPKQLVSREVAYYTYMKFKGCEAKVVILIDVDEADPRWNSNGLYTAMSRAVHQLIMLRAEEGNLGRLKSGPVRTGPKPPAS